MTRPLSPGLGWESLKAMADKVVCAQLIPSEIRFDSNANPPQFSDNGEQVIEKGTHIRMKLIGTRSDVDKLFAIGSIKEVCWLLVLIVELWLTKFSHRISSGMTIYCFHIISMLMHREKRSINARNIMIHRMAHTISAIIITMLCELRGIVRRITI
jgi:hypothetical protein